MVHVVVFSYSVVSYSYLSWSESITSVGEERANFSANILVTMWFLLEGVSSF